MAAHYIIADPKTTPSPGNYDMDKKSAPQLQDKSRQKIKAQEFRFP
ncbi:uncharacterized protein METZ01_LOCUS107892 [marine metagenome]|uniref:Uncharacterized protein n=1 Tax=marine metagenome TaxID=408172 RepID=A0A381WS06_9ZZZZ